MIQKISAVSRVCFAPKRVSCSEQYPVQMARYKSVHCCLLPSGCCCELIFCSWHNLEAEMTKKLLRFWVNPRAAKLLENLVLGGQIPDNWPPRKVCEFRKEFALVDKDAFRARLSKLRKQKRKKSKFMILLYL